MRIWKFNSTSSLWKGTWWWNHVHCHQPFSIALLPTIYLILPIILRYVMYGCLCKRRFWKFNQKLKWSVLQVHHLISVELFKFMKLWMLINNLTILIYSTNFIYSWQNHFHLFYHFHLFIHCILLCTVYHYLYFVNFQKIFVNLTQR